MTKSAPKPTFDQLFGNLNLPVKPSMQATGAKMTIEEFDNVDVPAGKQTGFSGMLDSAGFKQADATQPTQRVITV